MQYMSSHFVYFLLLIYWVIKVYSCHTCVYPTNFNKLEGSKLFNKYAPNFQTSLISLDDTKVDLKDTIFY